MIRDGIADSADLGRSSNYSNELAFYFIGCLLVKTGRALKIEVEKGPSRVALIGGLVGPKHTRDISNCERESV